MASEHKPKPPQDEITLSAPLHSNMPNQPENHHAVMRPPQIDNNDMFLYESGSKNGALRSISYTPRITRSKLKLPRVEQSLTLSSNAPQRQRSIKNQKKKARAQPITTTFHYFIRFPVEIRLEIFRYMFPHPRTISTSNQHYRTRDSSQIELLRPPVTFYINREARKETLRFWCVGKGSNHTLGAFNEISFSPNYDHFQLKIYLWDSESYAESMRRFEEENPGCLSIITEITLVASKPGHMPILRSKVYDQPNIFHHLPKLERVFIRCVTFKPPLILKFWPVSHVAWMQKVWKQTWSSKKKVPDISYLTT
ncbi:hypothetical protein OCU04_003709 [Sclerotinia nivalis]|uniref:2EXR domain-containing protein n=1 Tax=Sclerotinia nivalis TaxID=352851 RepID=A0A9X0ATE8_9HELO|nr:hypothetical protein OCU04_003709 [Sclerotinia nivalis]